jgi:HK97 family phage major capsid protein/HK97 family phage prohead protease
MKIAHPPREGLVRAAPRLEFRASGDTDGDDDTGGMPTLTGLFARFNEPTEINSYYEGNFIESIAPGAFRKTFIEQRDSMRCLFQHGMDFQVGDKPLGPIEELLEREEGPFYKVPLLDTSYNRDLVPALGANLLGASFRFRVGHEEYDKEPGVSDQNPKGLPWRTLLEVEVPEFGPVTFPAYEGASAGLEASSAAMRSLTDDYILSRFVADPERVADLLARAAEPDRLAELLAARTTSRHITRAVSRDAVEEREGTPQEDEADLSPEAEVAETVAPEDTQDPQDTAPPEGAGRDGQPHTGRRDTNQQEATPAAAITPKETRMTREEIEARQDAIRARLTEIDEAHRDAVLPEDVQTEYDGLEAERATNETQLESIRSRQEHVRSLATRPGARESGAEFTTPSPSRATNPYDVDEVRSQARSAPTDEGRSRILMDAALRAVDSEKTIYRGHVEEGVAKAHVETLLRSEGRAEGARGEIAERILATGGELYQRSFVKGVAGAPLTPDEQRALATFTGASGGFAVPYQLDPTIIPTSNHSVNPFRAISRTETIIGNEWKGVTSAGVTAGYAGEGEEVGDNTPTLAQPTANPERCQAFVPFSIEVEGDWPRVLEEMSGLISDAKDDVEATKFTLGAGHASKEPEGILTGATETTAAGGAAAFAVGDLYKLEEALAPRFRPRASLVANRFVYNKTRQFDTAGGAALWTYLQEGLSTMAPTPGNIGRPLIGYPAYESSAMVAALTTGSKIMVIGDFGRYFLIVDRIGMNVELVPTIFGTNQRPTGQRGLYAYWRNTSKVLSAKAFKVLVTS